LIKANFWTLSAASRLRSFEWTNLIAEKLLSKEALEGSMLNMLMATSIRVGYDRPSTNQY